MQTITIIYIVGALLFSLAISWVLYFYKSKQRRAIDTLLFFLRTSGLFLLFMLLINPKIERKEIINEQPILSVLVDNSLSISYFNKQDAVSEVIKSIKKNTFLDDKFDVQFYQFSHSLIKLDSLGFTENQTNIYNALNGLETLYKNTVAPIVLLTDGNQTNGNLYPYISTQKNVFPFPKIEGFSEILPVVPEAYQTKNDNPLFFSQLVPF